MALKNKGSNSNQKIKNAKTTTYKDIKFRSKSEVTFFKLLEKVSEEILDLVFEYEPNKFILYPSTKHTDIAIYKPNTENYTDKDGKTKKRITKEMYLQEGTFRAISYTPDFTIVKGKNKIYVDIKGWSNDTYPIKMKMFLGVLNQEAIINPDINYIFAEPHSVVQMKQLINIIKTL